MVNASKAFVAIGAVVLLAIILFSVSASFPQPKPTLSMSLSFSPSKFKTSETGALTISSENHDTNMSHQINMQLVTNDLVHVYLGQTELPIENQIAGQYVYSFTIQPGQKSTQPFTVRVPSLPVGIPDQDFSITVKANVANSNEEYTQEVKFNAEA